MEVKDGTGFRLASDASGNKLAVWTFTSLTVPEGATIRFSSTNPAALVAAKTVTVAGVVAARGYSGLAVCGDNATPVPTLTGGDGGASYGAPTLVPLIGGSGGAGSP